MTWSTRAGCSGRPGIAAALSPTVRIAGIDEAGRGPVVGPMVIAGVLLDESALEELTRIGVRDSKKLSPSRRRAIAEELRALPGIIIHEEVIPPSDIDAAVRDRAMTLNGLEISRMARIVETLAPHRVYIDLIGPSAEKFCSSLRRLLSDNPVIVAEHKADSTYPITAAASIIAKTRRDAEIETLNETYEERFGPLGSGYPGDPKTIAFLARARADEGNGAEHIFRRTWSTYTASSTCSMIAPASLKTTPMQSIRRSMESGTS